VYVTLDFDVTPVAQALLSRRSQPLSAPSVDEMWEGGSSNNNTVNIWDVKRQIDPVLKGPLPAIPINAFVSVGLAAQQSLDAETYAALTEDETYGSQFGNILTLGTLHIAPATPEVSAFIAYSERNNPALRNVTIMLHSDEETAVQAVMDSTRTSRTWAIIAFNALSPTDCNFSIRLNYSTVPNTNRITRWIARGLDTTYQRYHLSGFLSLQRLVDEYAFELAGTSGYPRIAAPSTAVALAPMPTAPFSQNTFYYAVQFLLAIILTMCQLYPVSLLAKVV